MLLTDDILYSKMEEQVLYTSELNRLSTYISDSTYIRS
jgi:hypothetical protein